MFILLSHPHPLSTQVIYKKLKCGVASQFTISSINEIKCLLSLSYIFYLEQYLPKGFLKVNLECCYSVSFNCQSHSQPYHFCIFYYYCGRSYKQSVILLAKYDLKFYLHFPKGNGSYAGFMQPALCMQRLLAGIAIMHFLVTVQQWCSLVKAGNYKKLYMLCLAFHSFCNKTIILYNSWIQSILRKLFADTVNLGYFQSCCQILYTIPSNMEFV